MACNKPGVPGRRKGIVSLIVTLGLMATTTAAISAVTKDLKIPTGEITAEQLAEQVYFANHFYSFKNFSIESDGDTMTVMVSRTDDGDTTYTGLERHLNNDYDDNSIKARDLAIFHSGKNRGMGMLITDFVDDDKSQSYMVWLPQLRKVRRFAQPKHEENWGGSVFTFGDVNLRKPEPVFADRGLVQSDSMIDRIAIQLESVRNRTLVSLNCNPLFIC